MAQNVLFYPTMRYLANVSRETAIKHCEILAKAPSSHCSARFCKHNAPPFMIRQLSGEKKGRGNIVLALIALLREKL